MTLFVMRMVRAMVDLSPTPTQVYEVGALDINGSARLLFHRDVPYHGIDLQAGMGVDVVADGLAYVPPVPPDCTICCEVLEHLPHAEALVHQLVRVTRPGGRVVITCAGPGRAPHSADLAHRIAHNTGALAEGEYYANVSSATLLRWCGEASLVDLVSLKFQGVDAAGHPRVPADWDGDAEAYEPYVGVTGVKPCPVPLRS